MSLTDYELPTSTELEYRPPTPVTLFGTNDPTAALQRMTEIAGRLVDVIEKRSLYANIGSRRHITAEGWTTLGGMLGIVPIVVWSRKLEDGSGWEARVEARTLDGRLVGAAESMCTRAEKEWGPNPSKGAAKDDYALRSMAQTRAIGRALRAPLGQIVQMAGYSPTAAEEMPAEEKPARTRKPKAQPAAPAEDRPTDVQKRTLELLFADLERLDPEIEWRAEARRNMGVTYTQATRAQVQKLLDELHAVRDSLDPSAADIPFE